ncbi:hypothetical protein FRC03_010637 [Tulasnella sp. 419]|nr:hypothetical protein FRC03_010637 [Tulasnella sp. 419]
MSSAGLASFIQSTLADIKKLLPQRHTRTLTPNLARKCYVVNQNIQVLDNYLKSPGSALDPRDMNDVLRVVKQAKRKVRLAAVEGGKNPEQSERGLDLAAGALRQLGEKFQVEMTWDNYETSPAVASATAQAIAGTMAQADQSTLAGSSKNPDVLVYVRVWYRCTNPPSVSELRQPDHELKKHYAKEQPLSLILAELRDRRWLSFDKHIGCYICNKESHSYTEPGLRWVQQKPHTKAIQSLPCSLVDDVKRVLLDVVVDTSPFILLVRDLEPPQEPIGIVVHFSENEGELDNIIEKGLGLQRGAHYYQHLDGTASCTQLAKHPLKVYRCDWCILFGVIPL